MVLKCLEFMRIAMTQGVEVKRENDRLISEGNAFKIHQALVREGIEHTIVGDLIEVIL